MDCHFELFDLQSGNIFDAFDQECAALDVLFEIERQHGHDAVRRFALLRCGEETALIAMEDTLIELVASNYAGRVMSP